MNYLEYSTTTLQAAGAYYGFEFDLRTPVKDYTPAQRDLLFYGVESSHFQRHFPAVEPPATVRQGRFEGIATNLLRRYAEHIRDAEYREKAGGVTDHRNLPRLRRDAPAPGKPGGDRAGREIVAALAPAAQTSCGAWLEGLPRGFQRGRDADRRAAAGRPEGMRIDRLVEVGAGYLTLERSSPNLSAGEAQRLRLASLLGSGLSGLLYVFDEPTIGLHQRDTRRLIERPAPPARPG